MKLSKKTGSTSEIWQVFVNDSSSTTGAGLTGLVYNSGSLTAYYHRDTDTTATAISLVTMTVGTFTSSGFKEIDATNMPGWYQFCPPNAALAAGAKSCGIHLKGATNMAPLPIEVQLSAVDPDSATAFVTGINSLAPPTNWNLDSIDGSGRRDVIKIAGTTQTARDLGASVLLSPGTGTGQISLTSGAVTVGTNNDKTGYTASTVSDKTGYTVSTVSDKTGYSLVAGYDPAKTASQAGDAMTLTSGERTSIADALLKRDFSAVTGEASRSLLNALRFLRNKWSIAAGTLTVTKEDDSATAWTGAVTTTAGNPVSEIDPS